VGVPHGGGGGVRRTACCGDGRPRRAASAVPGNWCAAPSINATAFSAPQPPQRAGGDRGVNDPPNQAARDVNRPLQQPNSCASCCRAHARASWATAAAAAAAGGAPPPPPPLLAPRARCSSALSIAASGRDDAPRPCISCNERVPTARWASRCSAPPACPPPRPVAVVAAVLEARRLRRARAGTAPEGLVRGRPGGRGDTPWPGSLAPPAGCSARAPAGPGGAAAGGAPVQSRAACGRPRGGVAGAVDPHPARCASV
jgi:hypothetical protein